ncbi:hypothetical protein OG365_31090 [Streptomyces sp. NBC_00853]|uniref:hypothetical protein n=1 Tax=Streptomyces sp. NBC_00853 TaxID=2903681 RepID=UPI0038733409|nr:hypothetical protein OG365_31090 [Streptomyces sp. NBC_00853]
MPRRLPRLTAHHPDGTLRQTTGPTRHLVSTSGVPRTPQCTGRARWHAVCACGWTHTATAKVITDGERRRHN